ncbi:MAG: type IVB secretion system protein IcmH/DotU [Paludibacterium sp.]|uniref:type IVB secretion system protein IcmH/DotU n=1 Tax=Paludibacterium sp. TaxID=1917523 RepID=UPI0025EBD5DE|nr:type IVB secretion system protein IcmH/DotU [Paludibacterium sp.]MBV8048539.1 type IVB secretion system protein IcmH/DotU [Paludibacterium sp.]MBV8649239.1 type IVB secretion system protein IcmH/DotU [Paludibacterium sp.]
MENTATLTDNHPLAIQPASGPTLREMLEDGVYLLFLLKEGNAPGHATEFNDKLDQFLSQFDRHARNFGKDPEAISQSKFAFCALIDEIILSSPFELRDEWERMPLQLRLFGEHLAGESFFNRLEALRLDPNKNLELLEVYYTCLLLGFQGKYLLEGKEKLDYLKQKLAQEILQARGGKTEFAPNWRLPQRFQAYIRHELPMWLYIALLAVVGVGIYGAYRLLLSHLSGQLFG